MTLSAGLTIGSAQILWYYLRENPLPVETIDSLFQVSRTHYALLDPALYYTAPLLVVFALVLLFFRVAVIFPPADYSFSFHNTTTPRFAIHP